VNLSNDLDELVGELIETRDPGDCPDITFEVPQGQFPNTLTIDFGAGCDFRGHFRSGKIIVYQTAFMIESGASRSMTYENYFTDNVQHTGTKVMTNAGFDEAGNVKFIRYADIQLTFPNGLVTSWTSEYFKTQIEGGNTDILDDNVFEITGSSSGINRNGYEFSSKIIGPLIKRHDCQWNIQGIISFEAVTANGTMTRMIDYGAPNAECDNLAEVTLANGKVKIIRINKRWW
jgi:hypothetical protein